MILLIGPGAVGSILATHLMQAQRMPLKLLVREKYLAQMQTLPEMCMEYVYARPPLRTAKPMLTQTLDLKGIDYLFICVKFPDLDALLSQLPAIPATCTIVSTLNGINALRQIRARLPAAKTVPMTVMFNGQLLSPLHTRITTRAQVLIGSDDRRLLNLFSGSGMQVQQVREETAVWGKLLINLANAICAVTHTTFRDLLSQPDLRRIYVAVLDEATALLNAAGVDYQLPVPLPYPLYRRFLLSGGLLPWWVAKIKNGLQDGAYPSMVSDIEQQRLTEVDQLNGEIVRMAFAQNTSAPVNAALTTLVQQLEGHPAPRYLAPAELRKKLKL